MNYIITGLAGSFTDLCREACVALLATAGQPVECFEIVSGDGSDEWRRELDTLGALGDALLHSSGTTISVARTPDPRFASALRRAGKRFLVAVCDPRDIATGLSSRVELIHFCRGVGHSCACIAEVMNIDTALVADRRLATSDIVAFTELFLVFLELTATDERTALVERIFSEPRLGNMAETHLLANKAVSDRDRLMVDGIMVPFSKTFAGERLGRIIAVRELFCEADTGGGVLRPTVELTGRARLIAYGPYIYLPCGTWVLQMVMAFSAEVIGSAFRLIVVQNVRGGLVELGQVSFRATLGRLVVQVTFINESPDTAIEFRILLEQSTFDGRFALGYAELQRSTDTASGDLSTIAEWSLNGE